METLFGNPKVSATFDLPNNLAKLCERVGEARGFVPDRVLHLMTLFPYFTAFEPQELREKVKRSMLGEGKGRHTITGRAAFRVSSISNMRFCPDCLMSMKGLFGETYWRRDHQLPSVVVCPDHKAVLRNSRLAFYQAGRHSFIAADDNLCPDDAIPVCSVRSNLALDRLHQLAIVSVDLLEAPPDANNFLELKHLYRERLADIGLMRSPMKVDHTKFIDDFLDYFGGSLTFLPSVIDHNGLCGKWLTTMVQTHRKAQHPLYHLLLRLFLNQKKEVPRVFGKGPWTCHNPLADHYGLNRVTTLKQHRNRGTIVGVYSCDCGYVYTRCLTSDGRLGPPRYQKFGPLLEPALRKLVRSGTSLRATGRALKLDPKTVTREAASMGITIPWKVPCSDRPPEQQRLPSLNSSASKPRAPRKARKDWSRIDTELACQLEHYARDIVAQDPPVRVCLAEFERRLGKRSWIGRRRSKLPLTMQAISSLAEDHDQFQTRRIRRVIWLLACEDRMPVRWRVMRKAGVTSRALSKIDTLLLEAQFR